MKRYTLADILASSLSGLSVNQLYRMPIRTCVPFTLFVRCIEDNKTFSIYSCDSSCSLDYISKIVIRELSRHYGYAYKSLHFDIYTDFDFLHTKFSKL